MKNANYEIYIYIYVSFDTIARKDKQEARIRDGMVAIRGFQFFLHGRSTLADPLDEKFVERVPAARLDYPSSYLPSLLTLAKCRKTEEASEIEGRASIPERREPGYRTGRPIGRPNDRPTNNPPVRRSLVACVSFTSS